MYKKIILNKIKKLSKHVQNSKLIAIAATIIGENINRNEVAFMTLDELIDKQNPGDKHHPSNAYNQSINDIFYNKHIGEIKTKQLREGHDFFGKDIIYKKIGDITVFYYEKNNVLGCLDGNKFYILSGNYSYKNVVSQILNNFNEIEIIPIKYPERYVDNYLESIMLKKNKARFPFLIQNIKLNGESLEIRSESEQTTDGGATIAVINQDGFVVGYASNEWGATLIVVASEYRGNGLGQVIKKIWSKSNPGFLSGGFTSAGLENLKKYWSNEVSNALSSGLYSYAIKNNIIDKEKLNKILDVYKKLGYSKKTNFTELEKSDIKESNSDNSGEDLLYVSDDFSFFILYNSNFFKDYDDKYILAFGDFSFDEHIGSYIYRIEYNNDVSQKAERIILECARQQGITYLYNDEGYSDYISLDGIGEVEEVYLNRNDVPDVTAKSPSNRVSEYIKINDSTYRTLLSEKNKEKIYRKNMFKDSISNEEAFSMLHERSEFKKW